MNRPLTYAASIVLFLCSIIHQYAHAKPPPTLSYTNKYVFAVTLPAGITLRPADANQPQVHFEQIKNHTADILWGSSVGGPTTALKLVKAQRKLKATLSPDAGRLYVRWTATGDTAPLDETQFRTKLGVIITNNQILIGGYDPNLGSPPK